MKFTAFQSKLINRFKNKFATTFEFHKKHNGRPIYFLELYKIETAPKEHPFFSDVSLDLNGLLKRANETVLKKAKLKRTVRRVARLKREK